MHSVVLPQLEAACREIFEQVYDVLERGASQSIADACSRPFSTAIDRLEEARYPAVAFVAC
jgi:hypothetical protein